MGIIKTTGEWVSEIENECPNMWDFSLTQYKGRSIKVAIICKKCRHTFTAFPKYFGNRGKRCPECIRQEGELQYIKEVSKIHKDLYEYCEVYYVNNKTKIQVYCKSCEKFFNIRPDAHKRGQGCPKCGIAKMSKGKVLSHDEYMKKIKYVHNNSYTYENAIYSGMRNNIQIECPKHGTFIQTAQNHLNGTGCPMCRESKGEREISKFLDNHRIEYVREKIYDDCRRARPLPFDFYLPEYDVIIEYDGIQHFIPIEYFGGEQSLTYIQENDLIKSEYCERNNITLMRIRYDEDILEILTKGIQIK